ncbi:MAG: ATP-dependent helicase [Propionibacteriaceae bacterium]
MPYDLVRPLANDLNSALLSDEQRAVVTSNADSLLVLGGPGTGKTSTLVEAVCARLRSGVAPEQIVVMTFSRAAARELRARISRRWATAGRTPRVVTMHGLCLALIQTYGSGEVPRLTTAPEQDAQLRELIAQRGSQSWPTEFHQALTTGAFAGEVRAVLARARQLGMDPDDIARAGQQAGKPEWVAVAELFEAYLTMTDFAGTLDYGELVHRARLLLADPTTGDQIRRELSWFFVDEFHDCDPSQAALLQELVGITGHSVVFADPDQSVYRFRGADLRVVGEYARALSARDGQMLCLTQSFRAGQRIIDATRGIAMALPLTPGIPSSASAQLRDIQSQNPGGDVAVWHCESSLAQADFIAEYLRRQHLDHQRPWGKMAVLVRSGHGDLPGLSRSLLAAGVPVSVIGDETPLGSDPAVTPLLLALEVVSEQVALTPEVAEQLLTSPLGNLDPLALRRVARLLRSEDGDDPRPSAILLQQALVESGGLTEVARTTEILALTRLRDVLHSARELHQRGATNHEVLWQLWSGTAWPERLRRASERGGDLGRAADRDLDVLVALFDLASRREEAQQTSIIDFVRTIQDQQIPADIHREGDVARDAVQLVTAHRAKGAEWDVVVVAGVQEGSWPALSERGSLLSADRLTRLGLAEAEPRSVRLAEERRLFYLACTRARTHLVVSAVAEAGDGGLQPSRFIHELGVPVSVRQGRPQRAHTLSGLIAELRRSLTDQSLTESVRIAAAHRLAELAQLTDSRGDHIAPGADPARWWGIAEVSATADDCAPLDQDEQIRLTGSTLAGLLQCPRRWYLERQAQGSNRAALRQTIGSAVHAICDAAEPDWSEEQLLERLDRAWADLGDGGWYLEAERQAATESLRRFKAWSVLNPRELVGTEVHFRCEVDVDDEKVIIEGFVDRIERADDGSLVVVDLKTGQHIPTVAEVVHHEQLGIYQWAIDSGGFADLGTISGGGEVVYLRKAPTKAPLLPTVLAQPALSATGPDWIVDKARQAVSIIRKGEYPALTSPTCRSCAVAGSCPAVSTGKQVFDA